jgi:excisionase family DNA binding protein
MTDPTQYCEEPLDLPELIERRSRALTIPDLAEIVTCSDKQLYKLAAAGLLPHYRVGSLIRLSPKETAQWLRSRRVGIRTSPKTRSRSKERLKKTDTPPPTGEYEPNTGDIQRMTPEITNGTTHTSYHSTPQR